MTRIQARYRQALPQLGAERLLTDGGLETTAIFLDGQELPHFASFDLLKNRSGREYLRSYYEGYVELARRFDLGFVFESPTWRASPDWARLIGYDEAALDAFNRDAIELMREVRDAAEPWGRPLVVSGCLGPRGDGYDPAEVMEPDEAAQYHARQIEIFEAAGVDLVTAITMTNTPEAAGIARAAAKHGVPAAISFTVETDGRLPTGDELETAVTALDAEAETPAYYMINCAHPSHFDETLSGEPWTERIRGLRVNASKCSHAELDEAETLDDGDPAELGEDHRRLLRRLPNLRVLGGCCGTDLRHVEAIGGVWA